MNNSPILTFFINIYNKTAGLDKIKETKVMTGSSDSNLLKPNKVLLRQPILATLKPKSLIDKNSALPTQNKPVSITYEEIGLFPRSFVRVFDRFLKQLFSDVEGLVIEEYRFYRYIILTAF